MGPTADLLESIEGNYNGTSPDPVSPLDGMRKEFGSENVIYAPGSILADGTPAPIPSAYLRTDASLTTAGLKGEYFDNLEFEGAPKLVRVDAKINFDWNRVSARRRISRQRPSLCGGPGMLVPPAARRLRVEPARSAAVALPSAASGFTAAQAPAGGTRSDLTLTTSW